MKVVLATGIYPPDIGGPATYVQNLGRKLLALGMDVTILTYGKKDGVTNDAAEARHLSEPALIYVTKNGGPLGRWNAYARALKKHASDADIVYAFSLVSIGVPLWLARLKKPKTVLRLGGDFLWERYTDIGGRRTLRGFYVLYPGMKWLSRRLLAMFDRIVFSTTFQERLYEFLMRRLPRHFVIENALPEHTAPVLHRKHDPLRLLFMGRFVRFKNLFSLLKAVSLLPYVRLTIVGDGPLKKALETYIQKLGVRARVSLEDSKHGSDKTAAFAEHDVLVLPSITEISPHVAIEARAAGLPVLLTEETGLSGPLADGMLIRQMRTSQDIVRGIIEVEQHYDTIAQAAAAPFPEERTWDALTSETVELFQALLEVPDTEAPPRA